MAVNSGIIDKNLNPIRTGVMFCILAHFHHYIDFSVCNVVLVVDWVGQDQNNNSPLVNGIVAISYSILLLLFCFANNIFVHSFIQFYTHSQGRHPIRTTRFYFCISTVLSLSLFLEAELPFGLFTRYVLGTGYFILLFESIQIFLLCLLIVVRRGSIIHFPFLSHFDCLFPVKTQITFRLHTYYLHVCE